MARHNDTGRLGESMALDWATENGFAILHQNWRHGRKEVDIIAVKEKVLHFIEVKTRRSRRFGYPEVAVHRKKLEQLICAASEFLQQSPEWKRIQFDVLSISIAADEPVTYFFIEDVYL